MILTVVIAVKASNPVAASLRFEHRLARAWTSFAVRDVAST
jgi:hypothetical protein